MEKMNDLPFESRKKGALSPHLGVHLSEHNGERLLLTRPDCCPAY
jgi:hypothetical protein